MAFIKLLLIMFLGYNHLLAGVILIDVGHGGEDYGARSGYWVKDNTGSRKIFVDEKTIVLDYSRLLYKELKKKHSVYLTRSFDKTIDLPSRSNMAGIVKADLFISIHANSDINSKSNGFEIFYLDNNNDLAVKKVEQEENGQMTDDNNINKIIIDLIIKKTVSNSKKLADLVHQEIRNKISMPFNLKDRGVKAGLFYVLALSKRPSILIELGFLSNKKDLQILINKKIKKIYAQAIASGIDKYIKSHFNEMELSLLKSNLEYL